MVVVEGEEGVGTFELRELEGRVGQQFVNFVLVYFFVPFRRES